MAITGTASLTIAEMREFAGFTAAEQRYIRRSLDIGLGRCDAFRIWGRNPGENAAIRSQYVAYQELKALRQSIPAFIEAESQARRVFWKDKAELTDQLSRWRGPALDRLVGRMMELHQQLLARSQDGDVLLAQALTQIARHAARGR